MIPHFDSLLKPLRCGKSPGRHSTRPAPRLPCIGIALLALFSPFAAGAEPGDEIYRVRLAVTSPIPFAKVPMDPVIDFTALIREANVPGVLDPTSIVVINAATGRPVPQALTEDFAYADRGRIEWVIQDPNDLQYEIRFRTAARRPSLQPAEYTPLIGVGDLLRYNVGRPCPVAMSYLSRLVDLTGDGKPDLVGCWNYAYRPGWPWDGIVCYPRVGPLERFEFGDLVRLRYVDKPDSRDFQHFSKTYMHADLADLNRDGLIDLVYSPSGGNSLYLYLNTGQRDTGGMPIFAAAGSLSRGSAPWGPCRAVDLNNDHAVDLVLGGVYFRNTNTQAWPIKLADPVSLDLAEGPCFFDADDDGLLDAVCLIPGPDEEPRAQRVAWQKSLGGDPPRFAPPQPLTDINDFWCSCLAAVPGSTALRAPGVARNEPAALAERAVPDGHGPGLLVQHDVYQRVSFYEHVPGTPGKPRFRRLGTASSISAVIAASDQAWPCACDWDADGDWDLLIGGGYGWPRILINTGSSARPAFDPPHLILSQGRPIRLLRDDILGSKHWHNMGYPYPAYVDWDADGLPDLLLPNETNRIFWYENVGNRAQPAFGPRRQIICDGFPDSSEKRARTAKLAADRSVANHPYPYEKDRPFFWRTGAGFADWTGDGLCDLVTHDGYTRKATLFVQYRDAAGNLRLRKDRVLRLADGRPIDDSIIGRKKHWTESFRCVDWDCDGRLDLIYSCAGSASGSIYFLRNLATNPDPKFADPVTLCCFGKPINVTAHGPHPCVADLDGDGEPDLLTCVEWSVYPFFSHAAIEMKSRPTFSLSPVENVPRPKPPPRSLDAHARLNHEPRASIDTTRSPAPAALRPSPPAPTPRSPASAVYTAAGTTLASRVRGDGAFRRVSPQRWLLARRYLYNAAAIMFPRLSWARHGARWNAACRD